MEPTVRLRGPVPGPRSCELMERRREAVPRGVANVTPLFAARTEGAVLTDVDGNRFIDFAGGIGVLNVGANHAAVVEAVREQSLHYLHTCFHVAMYEPYVALAEALNRLAPGEHPKKTVLLNSGAEAVENAVKIARRFTGRPAVVTFTGAFHGRTLLGMSLTAKEATYKHGFGPFAPEIYRLPACDPYRGPLSDPEAAARYAARTVEEEIGADRVAAVIIEPVQGEGGFIVQPPAFLRGLEAFCRRHGILLIADEIQTGFGRTGRLFAVEHAGVLPDLLVTAKSLANGMPLSAVTGRAELMDAPQVGGLGGTYGGNPIACAAALAVIRVMEQERLVERAAAVGEQVLARFRAWQQRFRLVGDARGLGAMCALELVRDRETKEPASEEAGLVARLCYERGLIILRSGHHGQVIRFLAPLAVTDGQLAEGLSILESALADADAG
jgi:4-aminobutyrate aminotransferase / (S)-3-amino-2-methylpropionate transaminase / 5-aminovalerate transaminase